MLFVSPTPGGEEAGKAHPRRLRKDEREGFSTATPALSLQCLVFSRNSSCCLAAVSLPWVSTFPLFLLSFRVSVYSAHIGAPLTPLVPISAAAFCYCCTKSRTGHVLVSKPRKGMWHFHQLCFPLAVPHLREGLPWLSITASFLPPGGALSTQEIERTQHGCGGLSAGGSSEAGVCRTEPGAVQWW